MDLIKRLHAHVKTAFSRTDNAGIRQNDIHQCVTEMFNICVDRLGNEFIVSGPRNIDLTITNRTGTDTIYWTVNAKIAGLEMSGVGECDDYDSDDLRTAPLQDNYYRVSTINLASDILVSLKAKVTS